MNRLLLGACLLATSCSHAPSSAGAAEGPVVGPPQVAWKDMSKEQRKSYMKARVLPRVKEMMASMAPEHEAEVKCATCHGEGAKDGTFKMPSPDLKVLPSSEEGWKRLSAAKPEWLEFMNKHMKPEMAALLGKEPSDPGNPKEGTFGCGACHTYEPKPEG